MRINEIAKEIGMASKMVIDFLNENGASYKNAASNMKPEEEALVRKKFGGDAAAKSDKSAKAAASGKPAKTVKAEKPAEKPAVKTPEAEKKPTAIVRKKAPEPVPEPEQPKVVAVVRSKAQRSYIPEEKRAELAERQAEEGVPQEPAVPVADATSTVPAATPAPAAAEEGTAPTESKPVEPQATVLEEMLLKPSFRIEATTEERPITLETPQQNEMRRPAAVIEEEDKTDHKHKKRKVVIPESEERPAAAKKFVHPRPGDKKKTKVEDHIKIKTKLRGIDIAALKTEEEEAADRRAGFAKKKPHRHQVPAPMAVPNPTKAIKKIIRIENTVVVSEFARRMGVKAGDVIKKLLALGEMSGINDRVNFDTATLIANDLGFQVENVAMNEDSFVEKREDTDAELVTRPPVVTVMGHVDHGKTKLLDAIRNTNVVDGEAGGITQHIGAYTVELEKGKITFLDTPGHEAFTAMRSRGAQATDLVILIVAADDGVMPQTIEAINHAKAANVPIIVAINKVDKPDANPEKVRQELLKYDIVPEEWGGTNLFVEISAKQRINIDKLLESILLQVEMMDLKANPDKPAVGVVIESRMDPGRGPVATALVKEGTLKIGDLVATATAFGYVRSMTDWLGTRVKEAGPSMAVEITGLDSVPPAGEMIHSFTDEKKARGYVDLRKNKIKEKKYEKEEKVTLDNLFAKIEGGDVKDFNLVIKGDVDGSVEAITGSLKKIEHEKLKIRVIHSGVGGITENDVLLASASKAVIFGFNVRIDNKAKQTAAAENVDIRIFSIIYDLIDSIKAAMSGKLSPIVKEEYVGAAEVRQVFRITKVGNIAGCMVTDGRIVRKGRIKLIRNNVVLYEGLLSSLKHFKDDAKEVKAGFECGLSIENYNDIKEGDLVECYIDTEVADEVM